MVHFVGAGSGARDLITVRGAALLKKAEVIIYAGSLVNEELLEYAGEECIIYNSAYMTLPQVLDVIKEHREKEVVRLHTGDPSIYGAIREQMDALDTMGIAYDICPGVSSLFGAAASLKAEYTLPGVTQTVIITRMGGRTAVPEKEAIKGLAAHRATMVIFLSMGYTKELAKELVEGGYREDTPCAIVYKASWADEKIVRGILRDLPELAEENQIKKTALIVVGDCLGSDYELSKLYDGSFTTEFRKGLS